MANDPVKYEIKVNNNKIDKLAALAIRVDRTLFKIATAKVSFLLPHEEGDDLRYKAVDDFEIGKTISIGLGYAEDAFNVVFKGIIARIQVKANANNSTVTLHASHEAIKMTLDRKSNKHEGKDNAIISKIIQTYGIGKAVDSTPYKHKSLVQYQAYDWDFVAARAEANGLLLYTIDDKICVKKPGVSEDTGISLHYNKDGFEFENNIEARFQTDQVTFNAWNPKDQANVEAASAEPKTNKQGSSNDDGKTLSKAVGSEELNIGLSSNLEQGELKAWSDANLTKTRLARMSGSIKVNGDSAFELNKTFTIEGFGKRSNGKALISGIKHEVSAGQWRTTVSYGLSAQSYHEKTAISAPANGGLVPEIKGLQIGKVKDIVNDEDQELRVLVEIPVITGDKKELWARFTQGYATNGKGFFFFPEVGDEVILGFLDNDPRSPIILGSVYSSKQSAPYTPDDKNSTKAIVTNNELKIEFNDENKVIIITTPGDNKITLSDKAKSIAIEDQNGNTVELSSSGISLNSAKDIVLNAKGKIDLQANMAISASAKMDLSLEGLNVSAKGKLGFSAQGVQAELKGAGMTTIKGAIVMIN